MTKTYKIFHGDCLDVLKGLEDNSVDSVCCDPPYGLSKEPDIAEVLTKWLAGELYDHGHGGFMGKSWDSFVPHPDIWKEVIRVLKPGGHALVFAGTRTQDLMTVSLRIAGFEVRDVIEWLYFSGFPKSHDVGKAFDKRAGAVRVVTGMKKSEGGRTGKNPFQSSDKNFNGEGALVNITAPATELARKWDGWGTALKPAHEPIIVVRKPLIDADTGRKMTVADCVEKYGTGAINVDASRIATEESLNGGAYSEGKQDDGEWGTMHKYVGKSFEQPAGRFPANAITTDADAHYSKFFNITPSEVCKKAAKKDRNSDWRGDEITLEPKFTQTMGDGIGKREHNPENKGAYNGNSHPTVKPTDLMAWLVRLVTPTSGIVLDPFAGSGSTLVAAKREGFGFIGVEREAEYIEIIEARTGETADKPEVRV